MRDKASLACTPNEELTDASHFFFFRDKKGRMEAAVEAFLAEGDIWVADMVFVGVHRHKLVPESMEWRDLKLPKDPPSWALRLAVEEEVKRVRRSIRRHQLKRKHLGRLVQKASA